MKLIDRSKMRESMGSDLRARKHRPQPVKALRHVDRGARLAPPFWSPASRPRAELSWPGRQRVGLPFLSMKCT